MKNSILLVFLFSMLLLSCKSTTDTSTTEKGDTKTTENTTETSPTKISLTPLSDSPEYKNAKITSVDYKGGKFDFGVENYELGTQTADAEGKMCANSAKGQHIHLILDNAPYSAQYTSSFDYEIEDGEYNMLAFLSRSYHESIKSKDAAVMKKITVKDKAITGSKDITEPALFYSRPKGTYVGDDTKAVMLDFYMANFELGDDYKVKAEINGEEHWIMKWRPYLIHGLPMGENVVVLTLVDGEGNKVDSPNNPVSRTFKLLKDPLPVE